MKPNPIFKWSVLVFGFWWAFLFVFGNLLLPFLIEGWRPSFEPEATSDHLRVWSLSIGVGGASVVFGSLLIRRARQQRLASKSVRGMQSLLGRVPSTSNWLDSDRLIRKQDPDIRDAALNDQDVWRRWKAKYESSHPAHVALAKALVTMYESKAHLPATHHAQGHGSRSLGSHCMAVAAEMERNASDFRYRGLISKRGKVLAQMQRADGVDLSDNPLVFITGLAHDMGKIDGYEFKDGAVVGCVREHDLISARMMGRLNEAWALPARDREALLAAIGHYHHPMSFPLDRQKRVADDLGCALMQHLHDTDIQVSGMEESEEYDKPEIEDLSVYEAFIEVVSEVNRINGSEKQGAVGQKWKDLVVLKESDLRRAMAEKMGLQGKSPEETEELVTGKLVVELRERGLMATAEDIQEVAFVRGETQISAPWRDAIAIRPGKILPGLTGMTDYDQSAAAVLKGNTRKNAFVDDEIEILRRGSGGAGIAPEVPSVPPATATAAPKPPAPADDDDDFLLDPTGGLVVGGVAAPPPPAAATAASKAPPVAGATTASAAVPPARQESSVGGAPSVPAPAVAQAPAPVSAPTSQSAPISTTPAAAPAVSVPTPTAERPKPQDKAASGASTEARASFAMKDLGDLTAAASAARVGGKGSRLEAIYNELIRSAPAAEGESEDEPLPKIVVNEARSAPEPAKVRPEPERLLIPQELSHAIERGELAAKQRPSGLTVVLIPPSLDQGLQRWVELLPESKDPSPASWLQLNESQRVILLQKGWESHVC